MIDVAYALCARGASTTKYCIYIYIYYVLGGGHEITS